MRLNRLTEAQIQCHERRRHAHCNAHEGGDWSLGLYREKRFTARVFVVWQSFSLSRSI